MTSTNSKKKGQAKKTSKIASPVQTYPAPSPTPVTQPEPEPSQKLETPSPEPVVEKIPFSFTKEEKTWLTTAAAPLILPEESIECAGFTMLYSLYYWESDLDAIRELGIIPSLQREYERLFEIVNHLLQMIHSASPEDSEQRKARILITWQTAANFLYRFSNSWKKMFRYFPWKELNRVQVAKALGKLMGLVHRLKGILSDIQEGKSHALKKLEGFLHDLSPLVKLVDRLSEYTIRQDKREPCPWYVAGEIKKVTDQHLVVSIERSGNDDEERKIPRQDFPMENPPIGQRFFASIKKEQPGKVLDIEPLPVEEKNFDELFIELFGREVYDIVSTRWKGDIS